MSKPTTRPAKFCKFCGHPVTGPEVLRALEAVERAARKVTPNWKPEDWPRLDRALARLDRARKGASTP